MKSLTQMPARWMGVTMLALAAGTGVLSCLLPGEVVLVITTDMHVPTAFNLLHIDICVVDDANARCGKDDTSCPSGADCHLDITLGPPQAELTAEEQGTDLVQLPLQLGVLPPSAPDKLLAIHLEARKKGEAGWFGVNAIVTSFSPMGPKFVTIQIPYLCRSDAPVCDSILCEPLCSPKPLPVDFPEEGLFADERCFDVIRCFEDGEVLPLGPYSLSDDGACAFRLPEWADSAGFNVALLPAVSPTGEGDKASSDPSLGFCTEHLCIVPVDATDAIVQTGPPGGVKWLVLPKPVCEEIKSQTLLGVMIAPVTSECPKKTPDVATVNEWSSLPACRPEQPPVTPSPNAWRAKPITDVEFLTAHAAVSLDDLGIFVIGGATVKGGKWSASNVVAHHADGAWTAMDALALSTARARHTATRLEGSVLVLGGVGSDGEALGSVEVFEPDENGKMVLLDAEPLQEPRFDHTATPIGNDEGLLVVGGSRGGLTLLAKTEVYRMRGEPSTPARDIDPRVGHAATQIVTGDVLVTGGQTSAGAPPTEKAFVYSVAGQTWLFDTPSMNTARAFHAATLLQDGTVLVSGGISKEVMNILSPNLPGLEASAEVYEPANDNGGCAWKRTSAMRVARALHTMTLLRDGRVLVVGGIAGDGSSPPPELYDPGTGKWTLLTAPAAASRVLHSTTLLPDAGANDSAVLILGGGVLNLTEVPPRFDQDLTSKDSLDYTLSGSSSGPPMTLPCPASGAGGGGSENGTGGDAGEADEQNDGQVAKTFAGGGCASGRGVKRDACALSGASSSNLEGGQWALLLVALILRRRRSR